MKKLLLSILPFLHSCVGDTPENLGVYENKLAPCPNSPNCVSSFDTNAPHLIKPIKADLEKIERTLASLNNANIVDRSDNYIRAEFSSRFMGYVDDVEFLYDELENISHVRSASRVGYTDLGANRRRVEKIRSIVE